MAGVSARRLRASRRSAPGWGVGAGVRCCMAGNKAWGLLGYRLVSATIQSRSESKGQNGPDLLEGTESGGKRPHSNTRVSRALLPPERQQAVLPERKAHSISTVRAEVRPGLSQGAQSAPHAPQKRHCVRRRGSDRASISWSYRAHATPTTTTTCNPRTTLPS